MRSLLPRLLAFACLMLGLAPIAPLPGAVRTSEFVAATPGAANAITIRVEPPAAVVFSHASGLHTQGFSLALTRPDPNADAALTANVSDPARGTVLVNTIEIAGSTPGLAEIHRWDFESSTDYLSPDLSHVPGAGLSTAPGPLTEVLRNTAAQDFPTAHLRVNDPLGATLVWSIPSTGFTDLRLDWLTRRSGQGAGTQIVEHSPDAGATWYPLSTYAVADAAPQAMTFDLAALPGVADNANLAVRVTFAQGAGGTAGNNRFDQVVLSGVPLSAGAPPASLAIDSVPAHATSAAALPNIVVRLFDAEGLPAVSYEGPVTVALDRLDGALSGLATVNAVSGVATFADLAINGSGLFRLVATTADLPAVSSSPVRVVSLASLVLPRYVQGGQDALGENLERVPFAWLGRLEGLAPGATYRYANRVVLTTDSAGSDGSGNMIFVTSETEDWIRTTESPRFQAADLGVRHHVFTAGPDGTHTAWFVTEPTGNARFTPGQTVRFRLLLNDGANGESTAHAPTTTLGAQVLRFGSTASEGTAIHGAAPVASRRVVVLHDDADGLARPLAATPVEITGADVDERYATFYRDLVAAHQSRWGTLVPNTLPGGVRRVEFRSALDVAAPPLALRVAAGGFSGTLNPTGGTTAPVTLNLDVGLPVFIPGDNASWHTPSNWSTGTVPGGAGAAAILPAPATADRNVNFTSSVTVGSLRVDQGSTPHRNRLRANNDTGSGALVFDGGGGSPGLIHVEGAGGTGHVDFDFINPVTLAADLVLLVNQLDGDPEHGALRLQQSWTGPGGLIKQGPGVATLSGEGKSFTGPLTIEQGVLRVTAPAVPAAASGVVVHAGGQLRLVSSGTAEAPRLHTFGGGSVHLAGNGRGGDIPPSLQLGVLGSLRYDPASGSGHVALANDVVLDADTDLHVDGPGNRLRIDGIIVGAPGLLSKTGGGILELAGHSTAPAAPSVNVINGELLVSGRHPAAVHLDTSGTLAGSGETGPLSGPGAVLLDATRLAAPSSAVSRVAAVLAQPAGLLGNGALVLGDTTAPLPTAPVLVELFLDPATPPLPGDRYAGGLLVPADFDLAAALAATEIRVHLADPAGDILYRGRLFRAALPDDQLVWQIATYPDGRALEVLRLGQPTTYEQWRGLAFADPARRADDAESGPDAVSGPDGTSNLLRYALGLGLDDPAAPRLPGLTAAAEGHLVFRFRHDPTKTDLVWRVERSPDLHDWTTALYDSRFNPTPPRDLDGWTELLVPLDTPRLFLRLHLSGATP